MIFANKEPSHGISKAFILSMSPDLASGPFYFSDVGDKRVAVVDAVSGPSVTASTFSEKWVYNLKEQFSQFSNVVSGTSTDPEE